MSKVKVLLMVLAVAAVGAGLYVGFVSKSATPAKPAVTKKGEVGKAEKGVPQASKAKKRHHIAEIKPAPAKRPSFDLDAAEEAKLTEAQRKLIAEIRAALENEDYKSVMRLVRRMQASDEWPDGIPTAVKLEALKALGYFGGKCLPEIVPFLGDLDSAIVSEATDYWEDAIADLDSDREISEQVILASKVVSNAESLESILSEVQSMRHSVSIKTIKEILANGSEAAKAEIVKQASDLTGIETLETVEQLDAWLEEHPDDPDDEFIYGGTEDSSSSDD